METNYEDPWLFTVDEDQEKTFSLKRTRDLDPLLERIGDARCVMLGGASHGTHEYYTRDSGKTIKGKCDLAVISWRMLYSKQINFENKKTYREANKNDSHHLFMNRLIAIR